MGVGAVIQASLYKPIAKNKYNNINLILASARKFFQKLAYILVIYVLILMIVFPLVTDSPYSYLGTSFLILSMSLSLFAQYYFGIVNQLFLNANQENYISMNASIITVSLNTIASVFLIINGASIQIVRLITGLIYLARPIYLKYYVDKNYQFINKDIKIKNDTEIVPQKWNGVAQHVAYTITNSTDIVVITIFSSLENVSVYSIHNMVVNGVKLLFNSLTGSLESFLGNLLASKDYKVVNKYFTDIEWLLHSGVTYIFGLTAVLINPFVLIYTQNVSDVNYDVPLFALLLTLAQAFYSFRIPYNAVVKSGGHFKQTQKGAVIEALINISFSLMTINRFGLVGIAMGTLLAIVYRTIYLVVYLSKNLVYRRINIFLKLLATDVMSFVFIVVISNMIPYTPVNFSNWILYAILLGILYLLVCFSINYVFYKDILMKYVRKIIYR